ncbi:aromatase [Streptacidiphilus sp. MAP12-20]|uniref:aromatase/cyclase n=1 Tax=Streptacidiphilus sp. MAP12-20 TaxID=3156299 RepID=UPI003519C78B
MMPDARVHRVVCEATAAAPPGVLYALIADVSRWPLLFPSFVHVEQLDFDGTRERLRIWAVVGDTVASWVSSRRLDAGRRCVEFRQDVPAEPLESMTGLWTVEPLGDGSKVTLECAFVVGGDAPDDVARVHRITHAGKRAQLDRLVWLAERWARLDRLTLRVEEAVHVKAPAELLLDFLHRAEAWPGELPHVRTLEVSEDTPGVQVMSIGSLAADGSARRTKSVRICFPGAGLIVYKHTETLPLLAAYTGEVSIEPDESGVNLVSRHQALLDEEAITPHLGESAGLAEAAEHMREELSRFGRLVLDQAVRSATSAVRVL